MKPEIHYAEDDCPVTAPEDFPVDEELHFEFEMLYFFKAKVVTEDLGIVKKIISEGQWWECPREPYEVTSRIVAKTVSGKIILPHKAEPYFFTFGKSEVPKGLELAIGTMTRGEKSMIFVSSSYLTASPLMPRIEGLEEVEFEVELVHFIQVPEGLEMCIRLMLPGEISIVTCAPDYAYDKFERPASVPEGAYVHWVIELLGFEMPKDWTGLNFRSIMEEADKIKNTGNGLFKVGKYELAKAKYEKVLRECNHVNPPDEEEGKIFLNSRNTLQLNIATCLQKMGEYRKSIETCNKVLDASPLHVKALYRRGMSHMLVGDFDEARKDFNKMISIDKSSESDAAAALLKLKQTQQEAETKARKQFKGLFDKKPGEISSAGNKPIFEKGPEEQSQNDGSTIRENEMRRVKGNGALVHEAGKKGSLGHLGSSAQRFLAALRLNKYQIFLILAGVILAYLSRFVN